MADETSVPPNNGKHISVTRMSVGTAEVKDMHVDLLTAVNASINAQTDAITSQTDEIIQQGKDRNKDEAQSHGNADTVLGQLQKLNKTNQELIAAIRSGGSSEEGGGGGITAAELRSRQEGLDAIRGVTKKNQTLGDVVKDLTRVYEAESKVIQSSIIEGLIHAGRSLFSFGTAVDEVTKRFNTAMDLSKSGIADFYDVFADNTVKAGEYITNGFESTHDDLIETSQLIKQSLQEGLVSPMVLAGGNLRETAAAFHDFREEMEEGGLDLYRNLGFREQNAVLEKLLDAQLRGDRMTDMKDSGVRKQTMEQIAALRLIAENTGLSLDELIKSSDIPMTLAELEHSGALSSEEYSKLLPSLIEMQKQAPEYAQSIINALAAGDNRAAYEAFNKDEATDFRILDADMFSFVQGLKESNDVNNYLIDGIHNLGDKFKDMGVGQGKFQLRNYETIRKMTSAGNILKAKDLEAGQDSEITAAFNKFDDWLTNKFPALDVAKLIGSLASNTFWLSANTAALLQNTAAHTVGGIKGVVGSMMKASWRLLKFGGLVTGALMTAKDIYDVATGDASGKNIGGAIGGVMGGIAGFLSPIPGGAAGGAILGNMAGNWIGSQFDSGSEGATPAPSSIAAPQAGTATMMAASGKNNVAVQSVNQTRILENIAGSLHTNNGLQREIRDRIGFGSPGGGAAGRDSTNKSHNIAVIPGRLGGL